MVKLLVRDRESIQEAVRRFRKLVERSGIKKEMRATRILRKAERNQTPRPAPRRAPFPSHPPAGNRALIQTGAHVCRPSSDRSPGG